MKIEILGTGCNKCKRTYERVNKALEVTGVTAEVIKVEDLAEIMAYGVMKTPALAIDGEIKIVGKVPSLDEIKALIS